MIDLFSPEPGQSDETSPYSNPLTPDAVLESIREEEEAREAQLDTA